MEGMVLSFQVGMVRVEVGDFKDSCLAHPQAILRQLQYHLPNQTNNKSDDLVKKIMVSTTTVINGCGTNFVHNRYTTTLSWYNHRGIYMQPSLVFNVWTVLPGAHCSNRICSQ